MSRGSGLLLPESQVFLRSLQLVWICFVISFDSLADRVSKSHLSFMSRMSWHTWVIFEVSVWIHDSCFVNVYRAAQHFLESLSCSCKEVQQSWTRGGVGDEGGDRTKEGRGLPWLRVWGRDRDWSSLVRKLDLSHLCFSLNFYFLMFLLQFPSMFTLLTYFQSFLFLPTTRDTQDEGKAKVWFY